MKVEIHHKDLHENTFVHVATIECHTPSCIEEALSHAWDQTQNINGSWSKGRSLANGMTNLDWSADVEIIEPLKVIDGKPIGHRSSMIGDRLIMDGCVFRVAALGFIKEDA